MKEYRVYFSAKVYDSVVVEAESEEEAERMAEKLGGGLDTTFEPDWQIDYIEEEQNENR
jgi:hypothetical protein